MTDAQTDDKSKKKKRLDDLLGGLHSKASAAPEKKEKESAMDSLFRKATEGMTDLNKLHKTFVDYIAKARVEEDLEPLLYDFESTVVHFINDR